MVITNPNEPTHRFTDETTTKRRRGLWTVGVVLVLAGALVVGYLATVGWDWRGAIHLAESAADEAAITASIESELALSNRVSADAVEVSTQGGVVRLRGTVESDEARQRAVGIAQGTHGVERVVDQLLVERVENTDQPKEETNPERS